MYVQLVTAGNYNLPDSKTLQAAKYHMESHSNTKWHNYTWEGEDRSLTSEDTLSTGNSSSTLIISRSSPCWHDSLFQYCSLHFLETSELFRSGSLTAQMSGRWDVKRGNVMWYLL